jgi:Fe-Mn family superoxide dismutase
MDKRSFIKSGLGLAGLTLLKPAESLRAFAPPPPFELPRLPYSFKALEPAIDARTMEIHHGKHHAAYVENLNAELAAGKFTYKGIEDLLQNHAHQNKVIRNQGGGHFNHSLFWRTLCKPDSVKMPEEFSMEIIIHFESVDEFLSLLKYTAIGRFGSGWAWLCMDPKDGRLFVTSTPNQDNPLMKIDGLVQGKPLLGLDVWEHAYYLRYYNDREAYLDALMSCINWEEVNRIRLEK